VPYTIDAPIDLTPRTTKKYTVSSAHRRHQPDKSRWTISVDAEVECFIDSHFNNWTEVSIAWGIMYLDNTLLVVGVSSLNDSLKLAKFVDSSANGLWHGYPADYVRNYQDRPGMIILKDWRIRGIIEKHQMIKIRKGKVCNL
jgi:hypothetical protein